MIIRSLGTPDLADLRELADLAGAEGFRFLNRFVEEVTAERVQLDTVCEFFVVQVDGDCLVSVGGVTPDPYIDDVSVGRLRHVFVRPTHRGSGFGRALVEHLEERAHGCYSSLQLRTDTDEAARFYERLGYLPISSAAATHRRQLTARAIIR